MVSVREGKPRSHGKTNRCRTEKIVRLQAKITKVQSGYEDGIYSTEEARIRIKGCQAAISLAEEEILKLNQRIGPRTIEGLGIDALKRKLELLRHQNLEQASFAEMIELLGLLDIKVYPSEDLKTVRIRTGLGMAPVRWMKTAKITVEKLSSLHQSELFHSKILRPSSK
jgi:hypothetical protein